MKKDKTTIIINKIINLIEKERLTNEELIKLLTIMNKNIKQTIQWYKMWNK